MFSWLKKVFKKTEKEQIECLDVHLPKGVIELVSGKLNTEVNKGDLFLFCNSRGDITCSSIAKYIGLWENGSHGYVLGNKEGFSSPSEMTDFEFIKKLRKSLIGHVYVRVSDRTVWIYKNGLEHYVKLIEASYLPSYGHLWRQELVVNVEDLDNPTKWERYEVVS